MRKSTKLYRTIKWNILIRYISFMKSFKPSLETKVLYQNKIWHIVGDGRLGSNVFGIRQLKRIKNPDYGIDQFEPKYFYQVIDELDVKKTDVKFIMNLSNFLRSYKSYVIFYKNYWLDIFITKNYIPEYCPTYVSKCRKK